MVIFKQSISFKKQNNDLIGKKYDNVENPNSFYYSAASSVENMEKYYELVADLISKDEFEKKVAEKIEESEGLLNKDTAARLVAAEMGKKEMKIREIGSLVKGESALIEGEIEEIGGVREFKTKNGRAGRLVNVRIADESGKCTLTLWNRDTALKDKMQEGMRVRVINAKVKDGGYGLQLSLGRWSSIWVEKEGVFLQIK